ncbi:MAG TPA: serine hydrolase [Blastocatellia bacterium]|nr:serine hydrolase [Blastocatellia bacterium]
MSFSKKSLSIGALAISLATIMFEARAAFVAQAQANQQPTPLRTDAKLAEITARLERDVPAMMHEANVPGLSIALVRNGEIAWQHAFGVKDATTKDPVSDNTVFEAASLSKPVFAYAVMKLVDAGKFDLDKPLNQYLPGDYDVGPDPRLGQITARRVLSHTTGFPNWRGADPKLKIFFTPGEKFSYSGEGFVYLSKVVERVTGEQFNDFMKRMVFDPLGMTSSSYVWQSSYDTLKTSRHNAAGEPSAQFKATKAGAASTLHTTAQDYARFVVALLKGTGLKKETRAAMLSTQVKVDEAGTNMTSRPANKPSPEVSWGLGVGLQSTPDGISFWHWGDNGDAKAFFVAYERQKFGVVFFANAANGLSFIRELIDESIGGRQPALAWINYESYRSPGRTLQKSILANGAESALRDYRKWRIGRPESEAISEKQMNSLGYDLLYGLKRVKDAIEVFKLNVEDYPQSANVYDSLAEAYAVDGNKGLAITNYQRSIELDPGNANGVARLKKLQEDH